MPLRPRRGRWRREQRLKPFEIGVQIALRRLELADPVRQLLHARRVLGGCSSTAPHLDLAAVGMLRKLHATLEGQRIRLAVAGPHGEVRDLLRREGFADLVGGVARITTLESILTEVASEGGMKANVNAPGVSWHGRQSVRRPRPPAPASSSPTP